MLKSVAVVAILASFHSQADAPPEGGSQKIADRALSAFQESRAALHQGEYRATGLIDWSAESPSAKGQIEIYSAFDFEADHFRFDRRERIEYLNAPGHRDEGGTFIRVPDKTIFWGLDRTHPASIKAASAKPGPDTSPFDVRLIGWLGWLETDHQMSDGPSWSEFVEKWIKSPYDSASAEGDTLYHLTRITPGNEKNQTAAKMDVWLDSQLGFSPVRTELRIRNWKKEGAWPSDTYKKTLTQWIKVNDVWVPSSISQESPSGNVRSAKSRRELKFDWISVNKPIESKVFTKDGLDYPSSLATFDNRSGSTVVVPAADSPQAPVPPKVDLTGMKNAVRLYWLIGLNIAVLLLIVLYWFASRWARSASTKDQSDP